MTWSRSAFTRFALATDKQRRRREMGAPREPKACGKEASGDPA